MFFFPIFRALSQNIGYIIAVPIVQLFLNQFEQSGGFPGCASLEIQAQSLESPALREQLKIPADIKGGIRIRGVSPLSTLARDFLSCVSSFFPGSCTGVDLMMFLVDFPAINCSVTCE